MNPELVNLLTTVRDWLRFAEAKNAALVAFSGIMLPFVFSLSDLGEFGKLYSISAVFFLFLSVLFSLVSFFPHIDPTRHIARFLDRERAATNLLFFGDIARIPLDQFSAFALETFSVNPKSKIDIYAISQIHIISRLTMRKLQFFNIALISLLIGLLTPAVILVLLIFWKNKDI